MSTPIMDVARTEVPRLLEDAAFLFSDVAEGALDLGSEPVGVAISFGGDQQGELGIWATWNFAKLLAANMLGIEENDPACAERGFDALGELLNMALGHCLTETYGAQARISMGLPARMIQKENVKTQKFDEFWLSAEGHSLRVCGWSSR